MNQQIKTSLGVILIVIIAGTVGLYVWKIQNTSMEVSVTTPDTVKYQSTLKPTPKSNQNQTPAVDKVNSQKQSQLVSVDAKWNSYTNYNMGFSIKIPKLSWAGEFKNEEVQLKENNDIVWFGTRGSIANSVAKFNSEKNKYNFAMNEPFAIVVDSVKNDQELLASVQNMFGKKCQLGEKKAVPGKDLLDVQMAGTSAGAGCFTNYSYFIKYSPDKQKVALWFGGQE